MRRQTGHPDTEALANFRAGLVGGIRGRRIAAHIGRCERCALAGDQLSAVTWALAYAPAPSLPARVEQRIGAAIAAEAAVRQHERQAAPRRALGPCRALGSGGRRFRLSPARMLVPAAACLLLAGLGYLLSVPGAAGMPSSAGRATAPRAGAARVRASTGPGPRRDSIGPSNVIGSMVGSRTSAAFLVTVSATHYRKATLRAQVSSQLAGRVSVPAVTPVPVITSTAANQDGDDNAAGDQEGMAGGPGPSNTALVPSQSFVGCVMHLTRDVPPALVQRATYQAEPAYVIAVPDRAWVVGLACTAAKPSLITSVALGPVS